MDAPPLFGRLLPFLCASLSSSSARLLTSCSNPNGDFGPKPDIWFQGQGLSLTPFANEFRQHHPSAEQ